MNLNEKACGVYAESWKLYGFSKLIKHCVYFAFEANSYAPNLAKRVGY